MAGFFTFIIYNELETIMVNNIIIDTEVIKEGNDIYILKINAFNVGEGLNCVDI